MSFHEAVRYGVYRALTNNAPLMSAVVGVYDHVRQPDAPESDDDFPFVVVGDIDFADFDTDTEKGAEATITIDTWSRYNGRQELMDIHDLIYLALHTVDIEVDGYDTLGCDFDSSESSVDADGVTRHGTQTYKLVVQEI